MSASDMIREGEHDAGLCDIASRLVWIGLNPGGCRGR